MSSDEVQGSRIRWSPSSRAIGAEHALLTDYVSHRGIFVRTDSPPAVMELLRMELVLPPTSTVIVLHGMVTELVAPQVKNSTPGAEIMFFAKAGEVSRHWDDFIQYLRENHPEYARVNSRRAVPRRHGPDPPRAPAAGARERPSRSNRPTRASCSWFCRGHPRTGECSSRPTRPSPSGPSCGSLSWIRARRRSSPSTAWFAAAPSGATPASASSSFLEDG